MKAGEHSKTFFSRNDSLSGIIHTNIQVLVVLERLGIKLGLGNKSVEEVAAQYQLHPDSLLLIINLFCNDKYEPNTGKTYEYIPDVLRYLKNSHRYFLEQKIPTIQQLIRDFVPLIPDANASLVATFFNNYIEEITEHIRYENETVFPYIDHLYLTFTHQRQPGRSAEPYTIGIYGEHHEDIETVLRDLKNILIRHLPQQEKGNLRRIILQELFELESDLFSHTRIENEVLVPLVKHLEQELETVSGYRQN